MFCIYHYFPVKKKKKKQDMFMGEAKLLLCGCFCAPVFVYGCYFGLWLRSSRWLPSGICTCFELETGGRGAHCHFISSGIPAPSHVYTNYCCLLMGSVCAPSLLSHLTGTRAPWLLSDMISLTTCHTSSCMEADVTFAAVLHVSITPLLSSSV